MPESQPRSESPEKPLRKKRIVLESQLIEALLPLEGNQEVMIIVEGIPSPDTFHRLADALKYEVLILVADDLESVAFLPGNVSSTLSENETKAQGLFKYKSHIHNHPDGSSIPSLGDMLHHQEQTVTYLVIAQDGISERRVGDGTANPMEEFYDYLIKIRHTPWKDGRDPVEFQERAQTRVEKLKNYPNFTQEQKQQMIQQIMVINDMDDFEEFFAAAGRDAWKNELKEQLETDHQLLFFKWDQEAKIAKLIRGESQFPKVV